MNAFSGANLSEFLDTICSLLNMFILLGVTRTNILQSGSRYVRTRMHKITHTHTHTQDKYYVVHVDTNLLRF